MKYETIYIHLAHSFFFLCENHTIQKLAQNDAIAFYYQFFPILNNKSPTPINFLNSMNPNFCVFI